MFSEELRRVDMSMIMEEILAWKVVIREKAEGVRYVNSIYHVFYNIMFFTTLQTYDATIYMNIFHKGATQ